jgi:hypothetical protein
VLRLLFVAFLWCHFFGFETEIKADSGETDIASREQQIKRHDGWLHNVAEDPQSVQGFTLRPSTSHRFGSSRPTRLLPTHGGKSPIDRFASAIGDFHPKSIVNGNYMAEVCASRDGAFVAVQLLQFTHMSYEPVTDVLTFEGKAARAIMQLFRR